MPAQKKRPAEFFSDWHWERHHEDLLRGLAGAQGRLLTAKNLEGPDRDGRIAEAEAEIEAVHKQLEHYGWGVREKRPAGASKSKRA